MEPRLRKIPSHVHWEVAQVTTWAQHFQAMLSDVQLFEEIVEEIFAQLTTWAERVKTCSAHVVRCATFGISAQLTAWAKPNNKRPVLGPTVWPTLSAEKWMSLNCVSFPHVVNRSKKTAKPTFAKNN